MKKLLLLLSIVTCFCLNGQTNVYQPWPADSAMWGLEYYPYISGSNPPVYFLKTVWLGDTVINTKTYTKVFTSQGTSTYTYQGGVREDILNEKLYKIGTSGSEYQVFNNQHLIIGDTFPTFVGTAVLTNIDSVLLGSKYHKQYNDTSMAQFGIHHSYIVGFGPAYDVSDSYLYNIICFSVDNINQSGGAPFCQLSMGIQQRNSNDNIISIYPNPATNVLKIELSNEELKEVVLIDMYGKLILKSVQSNIDISELAAGAFILKIKTTQSVYTSRFIKE